jgi:DNA replication protein DnaC
MNKDSRIGCGMCRDYGNSGYRLDQSLDEDNPGGRVILCECVQKLARPEELDHRRVPAPSYEELLAGGERTDPADPTAFERVQTTVNRLNGIFGRANMPYKGHLIDGFNALDADSKPINGVIRARQQVKQVFQRIIAGEPIGAYINGPTGGGKTFLACALLTQLILWTRRSGRYVKVTTGFLEKLRYSYSEDANAPTTWEVIGRLANVPYLVLDDLGVERRTDWVDEWIYNLIDARYEKRNVTIVTSNYEPEHFQSMSEGRVTSRLKHMCMIVRSPEQDIREYYDLHGNPRRFG